MKNRLLHRYWFEFEPGAAPAEAPLGCGVTAYSEVDARDMLAGTVFRATAFPQVRRVVEDVDVSALDPGHVLPNMLEPASRGVWFPMGHR
jgi:hypothetical protein